ncbi:MAG TPA: cystathionine gamma-synthase family protein [Longimicrobiales bacterium]
MSEPRKKFRMRRVGDHALHPETLMMGYGYDPKLSEGAIKPPIFHTSTFVFNSAEEGKAFFEVAYGLRERGPAEERGLIYSRINNPDLQILEERLTVWDEAEDALSFASGMAAISTTLLTFLRPKDVVVFSEPVYGGSEHLLREVLPQFGITSIGFAAGVSGSLEDAMQRAGQAGPIRMIYIETPANPTNALVDIAHCAALAKQLGPANGRVLVAVDNTFLGPLWQQPLRHGADLVLYSLTKYVGGHSDVIAGACLGRSELLDEIRATRTILGTMCDPDTGWLIMRSLETLKLRMTSQMKNARYVADFLNTHPRISRVHYLGFLDPAEPAYEVYRKQCVAPGSTFSFEVHGGEAEAYRFLNALKLVKLAVSLGGTESLAEHPATMTHSGVPVEAQPRMGITPGMVRLSVGIEHPEDVIADLRQALGNI